MSTKYLSDAGLSYFWGKLKAWAVSAFAAIGHGHGDISSDGKLGTASRAVVTDGSKVIGVSSVTSTELGYLSGTTSAVQTQLNAKAADSAVVHLAGSETVTGAKTFTGVMTFTNGSINSPHVIRIDSNSSSYAGFWDSTYSKWLLYSDASGNASFVGNAATATNAERDSEGRIISTAYVRKEANETINGQKTFIRSIILSDDIENPHEIVVTSNQDTYAGIWDRLTEKWLVYANRNGDTYLKGQADSAAEFSSAKTVALTGDVTGSASSTGGWSVAATLASSGVTAGRYSSVAVDAKGRVTAGNVRHSYTNAASQAKVWLRIANASACPIDPDTPLHAQFFLRMNASAEGVGYWQSWFVDLEVCGSTAGLRVFGNNNSAPYSQIRLLYENTAASVTSSVRPAVDIYLNYVLAGGSSVEVEEVYNSGFSFVADGVLSESVVPSGYENRASAPYGAGVNQSCYADYVNMMQTALSASTTLNTTSHTRRPISCTGTITLTMPSVNSTTLWYLVKNAGAGVVTLHPASSSVYIDGTSADAPLQPGEYILLACSGLGKYSVYMDGRWISRLAALEARVAAL